MKSLMKKMTMVVAAFFSLCWSVPCHAAESTFKAIFTDSLYGGLTGTLVGGAVLAFTKKPGDHLDYLGYGAAVGVLTGAAYGIGRAMVEMDRGRVSFSVPTVIPDFGETNSKGQTPLTITANLLRGKF